MKSRITSLDRLDYSLRWATEHFFGEKLKLREKAHKRIVAKLCSNASPAIPYQQVPRVGKISRKEFIRKYYRPGKPVVFEGAAKEWACVKTWSPEMIAERYGDDPVRLIAAGPENMEKRDFGSQMTDLRTIIEKMKTDCTKYARFNPLMDRHPELFVDLELDFFEEYRNATGLGRFFQLFLGGKGSATALHNAIANTFFVEVYGEKEWFLYDPKYNPAIHPELTRAPYFFTPLDPQKDNSDQFPVMKEMECFRTVLQPGDILFNPSFSWHYVYNHTPTIGLGYRWYSPYSILTSSAMQGMLTLLATNPPVLTAKGNKGEFTNIFAQTRMRK